MMSWGEGPPSTFNAQWDNTQFLLDSTTPDIHKWKHLTKTHETILRCALFLRSWSEGIDLPAHILAEIGARRWQLSLSAYSAEGDEIFEAFFRKPRTKKASNKSGPTTA